MPVKQQVLDLDGEINIGQYAGALNALKDALEEYRQEQDWCSSFWNTVERRISTVFSHDYSYSQERVIVKVDPAFPGSVRAAEILREIRGRMLLYVGDRITLPRLNQIFRETGLPEYKRGVSQSWIVQFGRTQVAIQSETNPQDEIREKYREFLTAIGDRNAEHNARSTRGWMDGNYQVPTVDTVPLM